MLKLLNSVLMFVILCGGIQSINGEKLNCEFKDLAYTIVGTLYSCKVQSLDNSFNILTIDGYTGVHMTSKNDKDVKAISINHKNIKFIPTNLGSISNLLALTIENSHLVEIRSKNFIGIQNLEHLRLNSNKLTYLPSDTFSTLPKLKYIDLDSNKIKYIGSGAFDQLTNLNTVDMNNNICVKKYYGSTAITQMKEDIKANCVKPNDVIQYEIEQKITKEIRDESTKTKENNKIEFDQMNQKIDKTKDENQEEFKALNDMIKTLIKATKEHQKDRDEIVNLKAELSTSKEEQRMEQEAKTKAINEVTKERDELKKDLTDSKKELTEAMTTIEEKLPKMKQTIEDFFLEVFELKNERHYQREDLIVLRSKLMEANEQLAECKINERITC